jgi:hypothetical protein
MALPPTKNMLTVLKLLYLSSESTVPVHMNTTTALLKRGLIEAPRGQRSWGGNFPHDKVRLSAKGRAYCKHRFGGSAA